MTRLCILTPHPDYEENWRPSAEAFRALFGDDLDFRPWTDAGDLSAHALVLPLLVWFVNPNFLRRSDLIVGENVDLSQFMDRIEQVT